MHFAYLVKFTPIDFLGSMRAWVTCDAAHMDCRSCEPSSFHRPLGLFIGVFGASVMGYPTGKGGKAGFGDLAHLLCHTQSARLASLKLELVPCVCSQEPIHKSDLASVLHVRSANVIQLIP